MKAFSPKSLEEALDALERDPTLTPIAGCTDLMVTEAAEGSGRSGVLDVLGIAQLHGIDLTAACLDIGAATTFTSLRLSPEVRERFPALAAAAACVGGWQIQNRATLGGNIANASPAGDSLPVLLALEAQIVVVGPKGTRTIPYTEFHLDYRKIALRQGEIITRIRIPTPPEGSRQGFRKIGTRQAQAISKVVVAMLIAIDGNRVAEFRLAAGSVAGVPLRLGQVEREVIGREPGPSTAEIAGQLAGEAVEPIDDVRSTAAYRRFALAGSVRRMSLDLMTGSPTAAPA